LSVTDTESYINEKAQSIDQFFVRYFDALKAHSTPPLIKFQETIQYSLNSGGKRFRPVLALIIADLFKIPEEKVIPWAAAVEMVHTYSLIHDDLPCMDNDDVRRGKPTAHKVYGEALALLAGDALLTESFSIISQAYSSTPQICQQLVQLLSRSAGLQGMVSGQVLDLHAEKNPPTFEELLRVHTMKTAYMIEAPIQGAAIICSLDEPNVEVLRKYGQALGLAFQVADDILDHDQSGQDNRSFTKLVGYDESKKLLNELSEEALFHLNKVSPSATPLHYMIEYNLLRRG
jgi:geranylgeranyl diphosphate synthase, type II